MHHGKDTKRSIKSGAMSKKGGGCTKKRSVGNLLKRANIKTNL